MSAQPASDDSGLVRRASTYLVANLANALLPFLLLPFLVRELGPAAYGMVGLFASTLALFSVVVGLGGMGYARASYHKLGAEEYRSVLGAVLVIFAVSAGGLALALAAAVGLGLFDPAALGLPVPVLALGMLGGACQFAFTLRLALWQMAERPGPYSAAMLSATGLNLLLSIALVFGLGLGWQGRAYGIVLPLLVLGGGSLVTLALSGGIELRGAGRRVPQVLVYSLPLVPHALASAAIPFCERTALAGNAGLAESGLYFLAFQLALPVRILANSINLALTPWSYKRMAADERSAVVRGSYAAMGALCLAALAWSGAVWLGYDWLAGSEPALASGRGVTLLLIASGLLSGFYLVVVRGIMFAEKTRALMAITVPLSLAYCAAVFALDDAWRVAQLSVLYQALLFVLVWFFSQRFYPQPWLGGGGR